MNTVPEFLPILSHGSHAEPSQGACVMEMVSFLAGEEFSDQPECVNAGIRREAIGINDLVSDDNRSQIAFLIPRFMNTNDPRLETPEYFTEVTELSRSFKKKHKLPLSDTVSNGIKMRFRDDEGDDRLTNQEYDQIGIDWLNELMDFVDKTLERNAFAPLTDYAEKMKSHESQRVNA